MRLSIAAVIAIVLTGTSIPALPMEDKPFTLEISVPKETFKIGEPISLNIILNNNSGEGLTLKRSTPDADYIVTIVDEHDRPLHPNRPYDGHSVVADTLNVIVSLRKNQSLQEKLTVTDLFDLTREGLYTIKVSRVDLDLNRNDKRHRRTISRDDIVESNRLQIWISD